MRQHVNGSRAGFALFCAVLGVLSLGACFGARRNTRDGFGRSGDADAPIVASPTREELLALRTPTPAAAPAELALQRADTPLQAARLAAARGEVSDTLAPSGDVELLARACLAADAAAAAMQALSTCAAFVDAAPGDARAPAAIAMLQRAGGETPDGEALLRGRAARWLDGCRATRKPCFDLVASLSDVIIDGAREGGGRDKARQAAQRVGRLIDGEASGPYRGDDLLSFADPALPVALVEDAPYAARFPLRSEDGTLVPALRGRTGLFHVRFQGRGAGAAVVLGSSTRVMRVLIDGVAVQQRRSDREEPATSRTGVHLSAGDHIVELFVVSIGRGDATTLSIVGEDGLPALQPIVGRVVERGAGVRTHTLTGSAERMPLPVGDDPLDLAALDDLLWRHQLARSRLGLTALDERRAADLLVSRFGFTQEALVAGAITVAADTEIPRRQAWSFAEPLWQRALALDPNSARARFALAAATRTQQPERGLELMQAFVKDFPEHPPALRALIADALEAGLVDEARAAAEALLAVARTRRNLDAAIPAFDALGDARRVATLVAERDALSRSPTSENAARAALRRGDIERALDLFRQAAEAERFSPALASWVDLLQTVDPARALELVEAALTDAPFDDELLRRRAALSLQVRGPDATRTLLKAGLRDAPGNVAMARLAESLDLPVRWQKRLTLGDEVIAKRRAMAAPFVGHAAVFLIDDVERSLALDGSSQALRHYLVELRTKEAIDRFGEVNVSDERVLALRVVKPDGRVVEPDVNAGVDDASLPGLSPGDIVEVFTTSRGTASPWPSSAYETRSLDLMSLPALSRSYVVDAPRVFVDRTGFAPVAENGAQPPVEDAFVDELGIERVRFTATLTDVAAARPEPFEPSREETARTAGFAFGVDAALWARGRGRSLHLNSGSTPWIDACAQRIAGTGSDSDKLLRLYSFVARRIEPGEASDASEVLATGQGRRTPLLLALLRGAGLRALPVALHFESQPPPSVIDGDAWSLLGIRVLLEDRESIAVVDRVVVLDALPLAAQGAKVLDLSLPAIARNEARIVDLPASAVSEEGVRLRVDLRRVAAPSSGGAPGSGAHALAGDVALFLPAALSDGMRRDLRKAPPDVARNYVEQALQASFPGITVESVAFPDLDNAGGPLHINAKVQHALTALTDGTVRFEHLFANGAAAAFALGAPLPAYLGVASRTRPLLVTADREELEVRLALGDGAAFLELPEAIERTAGPFSLQQTAEVTDGTLIWQRTLAQSSARVSPDAWTRLRPALAELASHLDARTAFVVGAAAATRPGEG